MSNNAIFVLIVIAILVGVVIALIVRAQRSKRLESRFGPEYRRAIEETGSKTQAEAKLEKLEKRVEGFKILPLLPEERANFKAKWQTIQARFVDDPKGALTEADRLIQKIMTVRGYPVSDFEQRAADISVNYPEIVNDYRAGHAISVRHAQGQASTEDMRQAMIHYRALFAELAGDRDVMHSASVKAARV